MNSKPMPKGVTRALLNGVTPVFVHAKGRVAMFDLPDGKLNKQAMAKLKIPKSVTIGMRKTNFFMIDPQPFTLTMGWCQLLAVPIVKKSHRTVNADLWYWNERLNILQQKSPTGDNDMPDGWSIGTDIDGDQFYINETTSLLTYDDPRYIKVPSPSVALSLIFEEEGNVQGAQLTWKLPKQQAAAFDGLERRLTKQEDLPKEVWNKTLNRHLDIMPTKRTRVLLAARSKDVVGQYINANYVRAFDGKPRGYICSMGPLPETVDAFWRMNVQNSVGIIIMATNLIEKGTPKCEPYWPNVIGGKMTFGKIGVTTLESETHGGYILSKLLVEQGRKKSTVHHFLLTSWKDHGVPKKDGKLFPDETLAVLDHVERVRGTSEGEALINVHCSAGVGRSGSLIAIDHARHILRRKGICDPLKIIDGIRQDRPALVQHTIQYKFIHAACKEFVVHSGHVLEIIGKKKKAPMLVKKADETRQQEKLAAALAIGAINQAKIAPILERHRSLNSPAASAGKAQADLLRETMAAVRLQEQRESGTNQLGAQRHRFASGLGGKRGDEDVDI